jgi:hypothetical protein
MGAAGKANGQPLGQWASAAPLGGAPPAKLSVPGTPPDQAVLPGARKYANKALKADPAGKAGARSAAACRAGPLSLDVRPPDRKRDSRSAKK